MEEKLKADIEAIVKSIFANREESEQKAALEQTLEKSAKVIEDLTVELSSKVEELDAAKAELTQATESAAVATAEVEAGVEAKDIEITALTEKLAAAQAEIEEIKTAKDEIDSELASIKLDKVATERMEELAELKVARQDVEAQTAKVRDLSDEAFEAYRDELVDVRKSIVEELEVAGEGSDDDGEGSDDVPAAQVDADDADTAALNVETASASVQKDYNELGSALADLVTKSNK